MPCRSYSERFSLKLAMRDSRTWRLFRDTLATHPLYRELTTYEAIDLARSVYRYLAPLDYPTDLPRVVHASAAAFCAIPAVVLRKRFGIPFLLTEHGVYYRERLLALGRNRTNSPTGCSCPTSTPPSCPWPTPVPTSWPRWPRFNATWEMRLGVEESKIRPTPNGVDPDRFPLDAAGRERDGPLTLVAVARLERLKDIHTLLRAFCDRPDPHPGGALLIHGPESDVAYARSCYALAEQLGLGASCVFLGPTADVGEALNEGDIAVLSSISEGFPFAAVEALMAGRPMVATEVGGVPEVIDPALRAGWCPPVRPLELADAICALAADRGRPGPAGRLGPPGHAGVVHPGGVPRRLPGALRRGAGPCPRSLRARSGPGDRRGRQPRRAADRILAVYDDLHVEAAGCSTGTPSPATCATWRWPSSRWGTRPMGRGHWASTPCSIWPLPCSS